MIVDRRRLLVTGAAGAIWLTAGPAGAAGPSALDALKATGRLRIGVTPADPWYFHDPLSHSWSGIGYSLGEHLAQDLGVTLVPVETTWANSIAALQANQIDTMLVLDPTEERRKAIDFPDAPLFYYALGALVDRDRPVMAWNDLDQSTARIGVTYGTSVDRIVSERLKQASVARYSNNNEAITAFANHRVDVVVQTHPALVVQYAALKLAGARPARVVLPTPVQPIATSAGLRKTPDPSLRDWMSERFAAYYKAGLPQRLFVAYLKERGIDPVGIPGLIKEQWS